MTLVSSDDDLDWEFAFDSRLGHPTGDQHHRSPPVPLHPVWQKPVARFTGLIPPSKPDSFRF